MTDTELQTLQARERELWAKMDVEEKIYKATLKAWSNTHDQITTEEQRRKYYAQFQAEQAASATVELAAVAQAAQIGAALAGGARTLAECIRFEGCDGKAIDPKTGRIIHRQ